MPSPAREVASLFLHAEPDEEDREGPLRTFSVRVSATRLALIDALAHHAKVSRNVMCTELLRVGSSGVLGELPDAIRDDVMQTVVERLGELPDAGEL